LEKRTKISILGVLALALILIPTISAVAADSASSAAPQKFPKGTICGDAQIGAWSTSQWTGVSDYQGFYSTFTLNNFYLSGGNSGTVSASSGSLTVYNKNPNGGGHALLYATFTIMFGKYSISGTNMYLKSFFSHQIVVYFNHIKNHGNDHEVKAGTYHNPHVPNQVLPCSTQDAFLS
jgi:hypothetical protein